MQGTDVMMQQTQAFIDENPSDILLTRNALVPDGAGGQTTTPGAPMPPLRVRIVQQDESNSVERQNSSGEVVRPQLRVVCMPGADITIGDTFVWNDLNVEVVWMTLLSYEKIADVAVR